MEEKVAATFCPRAKWYDMSGARLGVGRMLMSDIDKALAEARRNSPDCPYVIVVHMDDDKDESLSGIERLLNIPAFIFGPEENYFVTWPEICQSMKSSFKEGGHEFKVLTFGGAKNRFLRK